MFKKEQNVTTSTNYFTIYCNANLCKLLLKKSDAATRFIVTLRWSSIDFYRSEQDRIFKAFSEWMRTRNRIEEANRMRILIRNTGKKYEYFSPNRESP
jgi:hypothetical protein